MNATDTTPRAEAPPRITTVPTRDVVRVTVVVVEPAAAPVTRFRRLWAFASRNRVVLLTALLLVLTDLAVGGFADVWERHSPDEYAAKVAGCAAERRDLVFVGGSPVAEGVDPVRLVGMTWEGKPVESIYAVGLPGGTTTDFYHAVLRACPTPPRVLIYGATASDLNDSRREPHGPHSLMTWGDMGRAVRTCPEAGEWTVRHALQARLGRVANLFQYRHGIRMWAATEAEANIPGSCPASAAEADELREKADDIRAGRGYAPERGFRAGRYDLVKAAGLAPRDFPFLAKYRTGSTHFKYLHKLIDWCDANGTALMILDMPATADLEAMYPAEFAEYRARLAEVERERRVTVIRPKRDQTHLTDLHFADLIHMNPIGATVFGWWLEGELGRRGRASGGAAP